VINAGIYNGRAQSVQWGRTSKGAEQVALEFRIVEGDPEAIGQTVVWFGFFTDKTWERTMESLRYCGWKGDDLSAIRVEDLDQLVELVVEHDEYQGDINARVAWVNRPGGGGRLKLKDQLSPDEVRAFAARMKQRAKGVPEVKEPNGNPPGVPARRAPADPPF